MKRKASKITTSDDRLAGPPAARLRAGAGNSWRDTTIGEVCKVFNGGTPKTNVAAFWGGDHLWITPAEMGKRHDPHVDETARKLTRKGLANSSAKLLPPHSVILSSRAPIGHLVINTSPMAFNQGCKGLVPRNGLDHKYLYYYLLVNVELLNSLGTGTTFKELSASRLKAVSIPFPPLSEQKRIVAILDEALAGIGAAVAHTEKNLVSAREVFESHLNRAFAQTGERRAIKTLSEIALFKNGLNFTQSSSGETVTMVGVGDFRDEYIVPIGALASVTIDGKLAESYKLCENDILMVRSNGSKQLVGRCMLVPRMDEPISYSGFIIRIRYDTTKLLPRYLLHFFKSGEVRRRLTREGGGTNINNINQKKLSALVVPVPPIAAQRTIAKTVDDFLRDTQRLETLYRRKLELLAELKQSILHRAFTGALTGERLLDDAVGATHAAPER